MGRRAAPLSTRALALLLAVLVLASPACSSRIERALVPAADPPPETKGLLKAHLLDGSMFVFERWSYDEGRRVVSGSGTRFDAQRHVIAQSAAPAVALDSVALFETNEIHRGMPAGLVVMMVVTAGVLLVCITNPKSCYGSCPTFHLDDGTRWRLVAEGFSGSILPVLEATDVDALPGVHPRDGVVELRMTNEAQETHVVRSVNLLAVPRPAGGRAWAAEGGAFVATDLPAPPVAARGPEGDCLSAVDALDGVERIGRVDSTDLAARETLELEFAAAPEGELGLVLSARQSLLSTYLTYQGLAWLGTQAGAWLARVERSGRFARQAFLPLASALGSATIEVEQSGSAPWRIERMPFENGPLAVDTRLVRLDRPADRPGEPLRLRLTLTRAAVRIDRVALVGLRGPVEPVRIPPAEVVRGGAADTSALAALLDPERTLVTILGDTCSIRYRLPPAMAGAPRDYEWFLEGRGYYLEWMRREWLAEEDPQRLQQLLLTPRETLRALAPVYARSEAERESTFWKSRYGSTTR